MRGGASRAERASEASALDAMHEEEELGKAYDARLMARLWPYVRRYSWQVGDPFLPATTPGGTRLQLRQKVATTHLQCSSAWCPR